MALARKTNNVKRKNESQIAISVALALALVIATVACGSRAASSPGASEEYEGTALDSLAADFRLVDQNGAIVTLSDFRGQVVVLTFMDSQCKETCPLTAAHLRRANKTLGDKAASVAFIGINVNIEANTVTQVGTATEQWRLDEIPTWHFLTGSAEELEPIWKGYGIAVLPAPENGEIVHTPGVYLIDQKGRMRWYISTPYDETGAPQWTAPLSDLLVKHIQALLSKG